MQLPKESFWVEQDANDNDRDSLRRFLFETASVRGEWVHLDSSWQAMLELHDYPPLVREQLGQALVAVVLLAATIKFKGSLILQIQGDGPLHTLVAQATHDRSIRGVARWHADRALNADNLSALYGQGQMVLTIQSEGVEPYQGIVPLEGINLASALQTYFSRSEQLATRFWLAADEASIAGLFLQELPSQASHDGEDWQRLAMLADTVTPSELLRLNGLDLLYRLFHEEQVRVFETERVSFRCGCSRERIEAVLTGMQRQELEQLLVEQETIEVSCEFCSKRYRFDAVDIGMLFREQAVSSASSQRRH